MNGVEFRSLATTMVRNLAAAFRDTLAQAGEEGGAPTIRMPVSGRRYCPADRTEAASGAASAPETAPGKDLAPETAPGKDLAPETALAPETNPALEADLRPAAEPALAQPAPAERAAQPESEQLGVWRELAHAPVPAMRWQRTVERPGGYVLVKFYDDVVSWTITVYTKPADAVDEAGRAELQATARLVRGGPRPYAPGADPDRFIGEAVAQLETELAWRQVRDGSLRAPATDQAPRGGKVQPPRRQAPAGGAASSPPAAAPRVPAPADEAPVRAAVEASDAGEDDSHAGSGLLDSGGAGGIAADPSQESDGYRTVRTLVGMVISCGLEEHAREGETYTAWTLRGQYLEPITGPDGQPVTEWELVGKELKGAWDSKTFAVGDIIKVVKQVPKSRRKAGHRSGQMPQNKFIIEVLRRGERHSG